MSFYTIVEVDHEKAKEGHDDLVRHYKRISFDYCILKVVVFLIIEVDREEAQEVMLIWSAIVKYLVISIVNISFCA